MLRRIGLLIIIIYGPICLAGPVVQAMAVSNNVSNAQCVIVKSENCKYLKCRSPSTRNCLRDCHSEAEQLCVGNKPLTDRDICLNGKLRYCVQEKCFNSRQRNCTPDCLSKALSDC